MTRDSTRVTFLMTWVESFLIFRKWLESLWLRRQDSIWVNIPKWLDSSHPRNDSLQPCCSRKSLLSQLHVYPLVTWQCQMFAIGWSAYDVDSNRTFDIGWSAVVIACLTSCHITASDVFYWMICILCIARCTLCVDGIFCHPMLLWISSNSRPLNLLLLRSHQA